MQTESMREKLFTIRMTEEERERAERIAKRYGLNVAGVIRMLLKREDDFPVAHHLGTGPVQPGPTSIGAIVLSRPPKKSTKKTQK